MPFTRYEVGDNKRNAFYFVRGIMIFYIFTMISTNQDENEFFVDPLDIQALFFIESLHFIMLIIYLNKWALYIKSY